MAGVGEVETLYKYKDDKTVGEMAAHAFDIDQIEHFRKTHMPLFLVGVVMFVVGMVLQLLGAAPLQSQ
jgi:hypothetical protein